MNMRSTYVCLGKQGKGPLREEAEEAVSESGPSNLRLNKRDAFFLCLNSRYIANPSSVRKFRI